MLYSNSLRGPLPAALGALQLLKSIYLNGNSFVGTIPSALAQLNDLQDLSLGNNALSGPVPMALLRATKLRTLWLGKNFGLWLRPPLTQQALCQGKTDVCTTEALPVCDTNDDL